MVDRMIAVQRTMALRLIARMARDQREAPKLPSPNQGSRPLVADDAANGQVARADVETNTVSIAARQSVAGTSLSPCLATE